MIVTDVPTGAEVGIRVLMTGPCVTVKATPLLGSAPTVTTTFPVVAPVGTVTRMLDELQLVNAATVPLKVTTFAPGVVPKLDPVMVTAVPTGPEVGLRLAMLGATTVKATPLLANPPTVTTTLPLVAPFGTGTVIPRSFQEVGTAEIPLKVTVLVPCVDPKFEPEIEIDVPTGPEAGFRPVMPGVTVKMTPLLAIPPTVTTTGPAVAPGAPDGAGAGTVAIMLVEVQLVIAAPTPLKVTVLVP